MLRQKKSFIQNKRGMAVMELIPTLFIFMLLINFSLGFFGAIHSGILNNIASRNYIFETIRHRVNLTYHREQDQNNYYKTGYRYGGIVSENSYDNPQSGDKFVATARPIAFASSFGGSSSDADLSVRGPANEPNAYALHNQDVRNLDESKRNGKVSVTQIWIKTLYGICNNAQCGDNN